MFRQLRTRLRVRMLMLRLRISPKARKRYLENREREMLSRVRMKAALHVKREERQAIERGVARRSGDRLLLANPMALVANNELRESLDHIQVVHHEETDEDRLATMFREITENRRRETLCPADNLVEAADPWKKFHHA